MNLQVQHRVSPSSSSLIKSLWWILCTKKCITMCIFKSNSIVTPSAPLISTSNVGMPSDEPSILLKLRCTFDCTVKCTIKSSLKCIAYFTFLRIFKCYLKGRLRCAFRWNVECLLNFIFFKSFFVHSCTLTSAQLCASWNETQLQLKLFP